MASVLLVAPSADANDVGEAWVAFQWANRLRETHTLTVLTHRKRGRQSLKAQLPGVEIVEWEEPPLLGRAERFNSLLKPWYPYFHHHAKKWIRDARRSGRTFDIGHQPVPVAMRYPSPLSRSGIPYVIGPVGGSMASPPGFAGEDTAPWYVGLRAADGIRLRRDPVLRRTYSGASAVLGIAPYVETALDSVPLRRFVVMSETGIESLPPIVKRETEPSTIRLLFVGRLIRTKGVRDAVQAMVHVKDLPVALDIVGDGFDRPACEALSDAIGVRASVKFHGTLPRDQVDDFYRRADVFVFPSYREPGGNVPFEAMSYGLPLIVSDLGGPGFAVTEACGFRISPQSPTQFAEDIAAAIRRLVTNSKKRAQMGEAARRRVLEVGTWDQRMTQIDDVYAQVLAQTSRP